MSKLNSAKPAIVVLGFLCLPLTALAADVSGQAVNTGKGPLRDAVIYLEGGPRANPEKSAVIDQRNKTFIPHVTVVTRGTTIQFPNNDTVFHNVFAYFHAKKFDLGMYPRGAVRSVNFDKTGLVAVLCNVHSEMSAYIMVVDTPYHAVTDKKGHFQIRGVAPGQYTLHAWHENGATLMQQVKVTEEDMTLTVALSRK